MASQSPAPDIKNKSKLPQYGARHSGSGPAQTRDKPLFTAMRRPQFQQEFTTESLNNTAIGSPSPARPLHGASNRSYQSSRGPGLNTAFHRVEGRGKSDWNKERSTANERKGSGSFARPAITRQYVSEAPSPSPKVVPTRNRTRTPSPPHSKPFDPLLSPMSVVSESSPPREFAEAYKQINDEEDLAAQEDELDTTDETDGLLVDGELLQTGRQSSRRSSRRRSPGVDDAIILDSLEMEKVESANDSIPSLPSPVELDKVDQSRHEKDLQRLDEALGDVKAFSKARRRPKPIAGDLLNDDTISRSGSHSENSNTSGSILSDGSLNIPQTWGRKAKQGRTWLSRLNRDAIEGEIPPRLDDRSIKAGVTAMTVDDWQKEASMTPLPPAQDQDSLEHSPSPGPTKLSNLTARERVRKLAFGEEKFSAHSQESTSPRKSNSALDLRREREIQDLTKSAVTTNRLGELKEKRSLERVGSRSASFGSQSERRNGSGGEGEPALKPRPSQTTLHSVTEESGPLFRKNGLDNKDSANGLRAGRSEELLKVQFLESKPDGTGISEKGHVDVHSKKEKESDLHTPAPAKSQAYLKTPLVTGAWIDTPLPANKVEAPMEVFKTQDSKESVQQTLEKIHSEQTAEKSQKDRNAEAQQQNLQKTAPKLPGSALAAIITRAKDKKTQGATNQNDDTLLLDDSTILSLEEFVASGEETDSGSSEFSDPERGHQRKGAALKRPRQRVSRRINQDSESEDDVGLTTRLDRLRTSIQDAKAGVGSIQKKVNKLPNKQQSASSSRSPSLSRPHSECEEAGEFHDFIWPCEKCGHKAGSSIWSADDGSLLEWHWRPLQVYMPQLWFWPAGANIPRLTRLGWWTTLCAILAAAELILHDIYSPPFYASKMVGYGIDLRAPRPPFILAKLIWRHVLSSPLDAIYFLLQVIVRFFTSILGVSAGVFAPPGDFPVDSAAPSFDGNIKRPFRPGVLLHDPAEALGMDADEIL